jgi:hypothetical protein
MPQHQQLRGLGCVASGEQRQPAEHPNHDQVQHPDHHQAIVQQPDETQLAASASSFGAARADYSLPIRCAVVVEGDGMGIDVVLVEVSQQGTSSRRRHVRQLAAVIDQDDFFARRCQESGKPMLVRADPYGDLVLTHSEVSQFISEVESLISESDAMAEERLRRIIELACRCRDNPSVELHLQGD